VKPVKDMNTAEFAAFVATHLKSRGIDVVLTGGSCVTIYSNNKYRSLDLDFIAGYGCSRKQIRSALLELGFSEENRYFVHPDSELYLEFPSGPLAVGDEPVKEVFDLEAETGHLRILSPTECVKDRLAAYYHWRDLQCLDQAIMVAADNDIDLAEVERWSMQEGMTEEFQQIRSRLCSLEE
jgi:hypothetical protein